MNVQIIFLQFHNEMFWITKAGVVCWCLDITTVTPCQDNDFFCAKDNKCIKKVDMCNGRYDCSDGADERDSSCRKRLVACFKFLLY